jgi:hypothetical protein
MMPPAWSNEATLPNCREWERFARDVENALCQYVRAAGRRWRTGHEPRAAFPRPPGPATESRHLVRGTSEVG